MVKFSIRNGFVSGNINIKDNATLKNRLWALFYQSAYDPYDSSDYELTNIEKQ